MSAKILQALTDENPDLRKQIGCMTGILQLFDRHNLLTGKSGNHKKFISGHSTYDAESIEGGEGVEFSRQTSMGKFSSTHSTTDNQRASIESSRTSVSSSSCSSSFSSIDFTKNIYAEPLPFEQTKKLPTFQTSKIGSANSFSSGHESPSTTAISGRIFDIRDAVKDSIYGETRGLSVKSATKEVPIGHVSKFKDSSRSFQYSKKSDYVIDMDGRFTKPLNLNESLRVLAKLKEAPWHFNHNGDIPRSSCEVGAGPVYLVAKERPRYSYDGREPSRTSLDSRESGKTIAKLRDQPRLSLDGREFSTRNSNLKTKSNVTQKGLHSEYGLSSGGNKRPTSVVAKLMGLETMPNSNTTDEGVSGQRETNQTNPQEMSGEGFSVSSELDVSVQMDQIPRSFKSAFKEPVSPNGRAVMRPTSKFPIEPAPWKQQEKKGLTQKNVFMKREAYIKPATTPSVYSDIEKRLQDLEFNQSNKDLRALKQILEAMQAKGLLENRKKESQPQTTLIHRNYIDQGQIGFGPNPAAGRQSNANVGISIRKNNPTKVHESPIVIMKPARLVGKSGIPPSSVISMNSMNGAQHLHIGNSTETKRGPINNHAMKIPPKIVETNNHAPVPTGMTVAKKAGDNFSPKPQPRQNQSRSGTPTVVKENSSKNSGLSSVSPRLHQKRAESDRRARPPIPDSSKSKKHVGRQQSESSSPGGRSRPKLAQSHRQAAQVSSGRRYQSDSGDEVSIRSESSSSLASQVDFEVTSAYRPSDFIPSFKEKDFLSNRSHEGSAETISGGPDQPSPVSVLDASIYKDELFPSSAKNVFSSFRDVGDSYRDVETDESHGSVPPTFSPEINHKKLANINLLVQKLTQLKSDRDESTADHIASLCENKSPDHRYISEILLASGLILKDLGSGCSPLQLHPSGRPINPELYSVIEQTKSSWASEVDHADKITFHSNPDTEKLHRKLVFDVVNEILVLKLALDAQVEPWYGTKKLAEIKPTGLNLLRELCSEIDHLHPCNMQSGSDIVDEVGMVLKDDVLCRAGKWTDIRKEQSGVVLDIERLIFKDLVAEVVKAHPSSLRLKPNKSRRQLFPK